MHGAFILAVALLDPALPDPMSVCDAFKPNMSTTCEAPCSAEPGGRPAPRNPCQPACRLTPLCQSHIIVRSLGSLWVSLPGEGLIPPRLTGVNPHA